MCRRRLLWVLLGVLWSGGAVAATSTTHPRDFYCAPIPEGAEASVDSLSGPSPLRVEVDEPAGPSLRGTLTLALSFTLPPGVDGALLVSNNGASRSPVPVTESLEIDDLKAGGQAIVVRLGDDLGIPYCGPRALVAFKVYVSGKCNSTAQCVDNNPDPCSNTTCGQDRCRFGPAGGGTCCHTGDDCLVHGLARSDGAPFACLAPDDSGGGTCVECATADDCLKTSVCQSDLTCTADLTCESSWRPGCCDTPRDCDDGNPCTVASCEDNVCRNSPITDCCLADNVSLPPGPPDFGCTHEGADPCRRYFCIGTGSGARCRTGPLESGCCAEDADCRDPRALNPCTDPEGLGYGQCRGIGDDPRDPEVGFCDYPMVSDECCVRDYECGGRFPAELGRCEAVPGQGYKECRYRPNPDYCESPREEILFTELMALSSDGESGAWFELFNPTASAVDLAGYTVEEAHSGAIFEVEAGGGVGLAPGGHAVLGGASVPRADYRWPVDFHLGVAAELVLRSPSGREIDRLAWDEGWRPDVDVSLALIHPYLDNNIADHWRPSQLEYDSAGRRGSPGAHNTDLIGAELTEGLVCDDGDHCTLALCSATRPSLCGRLPLSGCCTADEDCASRRPCEVGHCDQDHNNCHYEPIEGCCATHDDCADFYPGWITTPESRAAFDLCAIKACVGRECRFGPDPSRPECCVAANSPAFGCDSRNLCVGIQCVAGARVDAGGQAYPACEVDRDLTGDGQRDCCFRHDDCRGPNKPPEKLCREGYCIGNVCRYGPAEPGCCVDVDDCPRDPCTVYECVANECLGEALPGCCATVEDCPRSGDPCRANLCIRGTCTLVDVPFCCRLDADCENDNPCTVGICLPSSHGARQCRYFPIDTGAEQCCHALRDCPDDRVQCTEIVCRDDRCRLQPEPDCVISVPYEMTFVPGHAAYHDQYRSLADIAWRVDELESTGGAGAWRFESREGLLGPARHLAFAPPRDTGGHHSCAVLPPVEVLSVSELVVEFTYAARWAGSGGAILRLEGRSPEDGADHRDQSVVLYAAALSDDEIPPRTVTVALPASLLDSDRVELALCVEAEAAEGSSRLAFDDLRLSAEAALCGGESCGPEEVCRDGACTWSGKCGSTVCPPLSGFQSSCNAHGFCRYEYAGDAPEPWRAYDQWIFVPPGSFEMGQAGAEDGESWCSGDCERPVRVVTFAEGFFIAKYAITVDAYEACEAAGVCGPPSVDDWDAWGSGLNRSAEGRGAHPQNGLQWQQARDFCGFVGGRLPSESEWEYAAKGPLHRKYPWGDTPEPTCDHAVFYDGAAGCGLSGTGPVGQKQAGASWCGALDMAGNVWEWVEDYWHWDYSGAPDDGRPRLSPHSPYRVTRGGSATYDASSMRSAIRLSVAPGYRYSFLGARCLKD